MSHPLRSIVVLALAVTLVALALVSPSPARAECSSTALFHDQVVYSTGPNPHGATTGDFNGDGILDVAVACSDAGHGGASGAVWVLLGLGSAGVGNGTFGPATAFAAGTEPFGLTTGDFNHDAHLDLAVANLASGNVSILIGRGDGTFAAPASYPAGNGPFNVVTGDFNHDGIMDLALPNNTSATVAVLLGRGSGVGDGTFGAATLYPIAQVSTGIATGDFNGDGNTDLVATCNYAGLVAVLDGLGNGTFGSPRNFTATTEPFAVAVADFNEDGILDIAVGDAGFNGVGILLGQGSGGVGNGSFGSPTIFNNGNQCAGLVVGDWNQDGILDLAAGDGRRNVVWTFLGQGSGGVGNGTFGSITSYPAGAVSFPLTSGDFNEGGFTDLVAVNYGDASISILFSGCEPAPPPPSNAPVLTRVRDVPNDDGGFVFVTWLRSRLDVPALRTITGYRVWRRIHPESGMAAGASEESADGVRRLTTQTPRGDGTVETTYWEEIATLPAQGLEGYGYTSPTTQDSMRSSNPYTAFFITALTSDPFVFYSSNIDSGYSVDNLAPSPPARLAGEATSDGIVLHWDANTEGDLASYRIYRGGSDDFVPSPETMIAEKADTGYVDPAGSTASFYKVSAVDVHGNESGYSVFATGQPTAVVDAELVFSLRSVAPNPCTTGEIVVTFSLPDPSPAILELIDVTGRRVVHRPVGQLGRGGHSVALAEGSKLRVGLYWVRLTQTYRSQSLKLVVAR